MERFVKPPFVDTGRVSRCGCGDERPSSPSLPFFSDRRPEAMDPQFHACATCHMYEVVHHAINPGTGRPGDTSHPWTPMVFEYDSHYCGCRGWD